MPIYRHERERPQPWSLHRKRAKFAWLIPLYWFEWVSSWVAYWLQGWAFLEALEYIGTFSILFAVILYFVEGRDRIKQKHYQAWQVINTAQGKGGSGGRIDALEELWADSVPLVGVDVSDAFLQGLHLDGAELLRANFRAADVRGGSFRGAQLEFADLTSANFRGASFNKADLRNANLQDTDFTGADLSEADLEGVDLSKADLRDTNLRDIKWEKIADLKLANIHGVRNAPPNFLTWAAAKGAVSIESDAEWLALSAKE
jgi:hypothetical protein